MGRQHFPPPSSSSSSSSSPLTWAACLIYSLVAISWMPMTTMAQLNVVYAAGNVADLNPKFPYSSCLHTPANPSPYSFLPQIDVRGNGQFCFTLKVNTTGCKGTCCSVGLKKIEFDVNSKCAEKSATIKAYIDGKPTATAPSIIQYVFANGMYKYV
ncbi:hypothetical protein Vretifemale_13208, partial [Volvox reticuliferus]